MASVSMIPPLTKTAAHGRLMTSAVQRCQNVPFRLSGCVDPGRRRRFFHWRATSSRTVVTRLRAYARRPSSESSAGSRVTAVRIASATTMIAPVAIDRITVESTRNSPASAMITVRPEKTTAMPEVRIAILRASSGSRPSRISSRYRARTNRE